MAHSLGPAKRFTMEDHNFPPGSQFPAHGDTKTNLLQIPKCAQPAAPTGMAEGALGWALPAEVVARERRAIHLRTEE